MAINDLTRLIGETKRNIARARSYVASEDKRAARARKAAEAARKRARVIELVGNGS